MNNKQFPLFQAEVSIRWTDIDEYGILHHSKYLVLLEEARLQWLAHTKEDHLTNFFMPIVNVNINYRRSITYPANLLVKLYAHDIKSKSWIFYHEISYIDAPDVILSDASIKSVCLNKQTWRAIVLPEHLAKLLKDSSYFKVN